MQAGCQLEGEAKFGCAFDEITKLLKVRNRLGCHAASSKFGENSCLLYRFKVFLFPVERLRGVNQRLRFDRGSASMILLCKHRKRRDSFGQEQIQIASRHHKMAEHPALRRASILLVSSKGIATGKLSGRECACVVDRVFEQCPERRGYESSHDR